MSDVTHLLDAAQQGDTQAAGELLPLVYDELRRLAARKLAQEAPGHTLEATALVHEAYLRLVGEADERRWQGRRHFFAAAAEAMRRILIDRARARGAEKRGGGRTRQSLDDVDLAAPDVCDDLLAIDEALTRLAAQDAVKAELVKLRFFAGLTLEQAAAVLAISPATADRYWAYARVWLLRDMTSPPTAKNP
jgi:RNA polymerase sigma factor (TIGR02999 family)